MNYDNMISERRGWHERAAKGYLLREKYSLKEEIAGLERSLKIAQTEMDIQIEKNINLRKEIDKLVEANNVLSKCLQRVYSTIESPHQLLIHDQLWKDQVVKRLNDLERRVESYDNRTNQH